MIETTMAFLHFLRLWLHMANKLGSESGDPMRNAGTRSESVTSRTKNTKPKTKEIGEDLSSVSAKVPQPAVGRLSLYFRELHRLHDTGEKQINSADLGRLVNVSPAVVRRDLSSLGTIGRRGVGYSIAVLIDRIGMLLGTGVNWRVIMIGVGSLGNALLRYRGFERLGFELVAAYDVDAARIGQTVGGVEVRDANELTADLDRLKPDLGIIAVPAEKASEVAQSLVAGGIGGILNFAPTTLKCPGSVAVVNVDLASELQRLAFSVQSQSTPKGV
jgi:redox-sensing transcriptional repressor